MKRFLVVMLVVIMAIATALCFVGCEETTAAMKTRTDTKNAYSAAAEIVNNQSAPTDLEYSLERYNVIRRAYWVNGQREKAMSLPCSIERPLGYIVLFSNSGAVIGRFIVDGKVSSLNSYLFPAYYDIPNDNQSETEIPGIDGCYGENVSGIFFFTTDGKYIEWTGDFLYSDIPFSVDDPILKTE